MSEPNVGESLALIRAVQDALCDLSLWRGWSSAAEFEHYTRTREYMRAYRRHWQLEGPR